MTGMTPARLRGAVLLVGAAALFLLVDAGPVPYRWFPFLIGVVYLVAAAAGRSRSALWTPGLTLLAVGLTDGLWLASRSGNSFELLALTALSLGTGGLLAALLGERAGFQISASSVALSVLLYGGFALIDARGIAPFTQHAWPYAALLALWGLVELLRPTQPLPLEPARASTRGSVTT